MCSFDMDETYLRHHKCVEHENRWGIPVGDYSLDGFFSDSNPDVDVPDHVRIDINSDPSSDDPSSSGSDDSDDSTSESSSDSDSEDEKMTRGDIERFSREMMELVVKGNITQTAMESCLKIFHALLKKAGCEEEFENVPRSFFLLEKWSKQDEDPIYSAMLDICPTKDHYVYKENSNETCCPLCGTTTIYS